MESDSRISLANTSSRNTDDEISLIEILNILLRHRRMIVLLPVLVAGVIGIRTLTQPRTYSASASFMPQVPEGRSGSSAAALARQFGVNLGGGDRPGGSPQFYANLLQTRDVLRKAVEAEYHVVDAELGKRQATLVEFYEIDDMPFTPAWRKGVERLKNNLSVSVDRETGVIRLAVSALSPDLAEQILERLLKLVNDFNLESRQSQAQEEVRFISARMEEVHQDLLVSKSRLQSFLQTNRQFQNSPELLFEHDDLQRQVAMRQGVYTALVQAREQARIDAVRDTPLLTLIDNPTGSAAPEGRGTVRKSVLAFFVVLLLTMIAAFILELGRRSRREEGGSYHEFQRLAREARKDLTSPSQWFLRRSRNDNHPKADPNVG